MRMDFLWLYDVLWKGCSAFRDKAYVTRYNVPQGLIQLNDLGQINNALHLEEELKACIYGIVGHKF